MTLVAGVDSSTQACKVVVRDTDSGTLVRSGRAGHPDGTEIDPRRWREALQVAVEDAGGLDDVSALSVAGQQHGMVTLDDEVRPVRYALLWNDTRSAADARDPGCGDGARGRVGRWALVGRKDGLRAGRLADRVEFALARAERTRER